MLVLGALPGMRTSTLAPHPSMAPHSTLAPRSTTATAQPHTISPTPPPPAHRRHHDRSSTVIIEPYPQQYAIAVEPSCPYGTAWDAYSQTCVLIASAAPAQDDDDAPTEHTKRRRRSWAFIAIVLALGGVAGALLAD